MVHNKIWYIIHIILLRVVTMRDTGIGQLSPRDTTLSLKVKFVIPLGAHTSAVRELRSLTSDNAIYYLVLVTDTYLVFNHILVFIIYSFIILDTQQSYLLITHSLWILIHIDTISR